MAGDVSEAPGFDASSGLDSDETPDAAVTDVAAAPDSALAGLRARREQARNQLHTDLLVPRYDPPVYVRFRALEQRELAAAERKRDRAKKNADRDVVVNAGLLVEACLGVFEVIDGREVSIDPDDRDGEWPRFDQRLAQLLGEPDLTAAVQVARTLYLTDGDILATATQLATWSGYSTDDLDRGLEGN